METKTTDASGTYSFIVIESGAYTIVETQPIGYTSASADTIAIDVGTSAITGRDFAETVDPSASTAPTAQPSPTEVQPEPTTAPVARDEPSGGISLWIFVGAGLVVLAVAILAFLLGSHKQRRQAE